MHIPKIAENMKDRQMPRVRLLLQGDSGKGKTWSAMTFPNPLVLDFDDGMTAFVGKDIPIIPFHSHEFMLKYADGKYKPKNADAQPNRRDAFKHFLKNEATQMTAEQTLVVDGLTGLEAATSQQLAHEPRLTNKGNVDDFAPWQFRIEYYGEIHVYLKALKCHVVVTCHEMKLRDEKTGALIDKVQPLIPGKFITQLKSHYTDVFRCLGVDKKNPQGKVIDTEYFWQVRSDNMFDAKTRLAFPPETITIKPHFEIFNQYQTVNQTNPYSK